MAWFTTDEGKHVNTEWFDEDEKRKYKQLEQNQQEADKLNTNQKYTSRQTEKQKYEKVSGLIFGVAKVTDSYIDIDGYSNKSTEKGMLSDMAKAVEKYDKSEADAIRSMIKDNEIQQIHARKNEPGAQYICEWEDVPSASRYVDENGKDSILSGKEGVEVETKDGKYYCHVRIIR